MKAEQVDEDVEKKMSRGLRCQKTVNAVLAVLSVVLFFLTQPLVWRFRLVDWWTVLFMLLCGTALAMLIWRKNRKQAPKKTQLKSKNRKGMHICICTQKSIAMALCSAALAVGCRTGRGGEDRAHPPVPSHPPTPPQGQRMYN